MIVSVETENSVAAVGYAGNKLIVGFTKRIIRGLKFEIETPLGLAIAYDRSPRGGAVAAAKPKPAPGPFKRGVLARRGVVRRG
jgi:hypothetical protein